MLPLVGFPALSQHQHAHTPPHHQVFYYALKAVIHPTAPLYDAAASSGAGALRPAAIRALKRVFAACDADADGTLSDAELNAFQVRCFSAPLSPDELAGVKKVVADRLPAGVTPGGNLTLAGFLFLHALFIERGRLETTWAVLRTFGYGDDLTLAPAALSGACGPTPRSPGATPHLTPRAVSFFEAAFRRADRDGDGELAVAEEADLWSSAPSPPWPAARDVPPLAPRGPAGGLTPAGLVGRLHALAAADPAAAAAAAMYAGLDARAGEVVACARPRRAGDAASAAPTARPLLRGLVFGPDAASSARRTLVAAVAAATPPAATTTPLSAVGPLPPPPPPPAPPDAKPVPPPPTQYLQLTEVAEDGVAGLAADPSPLTGVDVAAFVFDVGDAASFDAAAASLVTLADAAGPGLPCVLVAAGDGGSAADAAAAAAAACGALDLRLPVPFSSLLPSDAAGAVAALAAAARGGARATPATPALRARRARERAFRRALLAAGGGALAAAAVYAVWRAAKPVQGEGERVEVKKGG